MEVELPETKEGCVSMRACVCSVCGLCLGCKHEDPSSIPRNHIKKKKKLAMVANACGPRAGEGEAGRSWGSLTSQPSVLDEFQTSQVGGLHVLAHPHNTYLHTCAWTPRRLAKPDVVVHSSNASYMKAVRRIVSLRHDLAT